MVQRSGKAAGVARAPGYNPAFGTQKGKKWVVKAGGCFAAGVPISGSTTGAKVMHILTQIAFVELFATLCKYPSSFACV